MLIIIRKLNESFMIGDEIEIKVAAIDNKQVVVEIQAPDDFKIIRKKLLTKAARSKSNFNH